MARDLSDAKLTRCTAAPRQAVATCFFNFIQMTTTRVFFRSNYLYPHLQPQMAVDCLEIFSKKIIRYSTKFEFCMSDQVEWTTEGQR